VTLLLPTVLLGQALASGANKNCCFLWQINVTRDMGGIFSLALWAQLQFQFWEIINTPYAVKLYRDDGRQPSPAL